MREAAAFRRFFHKSRLLRYPILLLPKQSLEKVGVEKSPEIEFVEVREVECPDCEKRFTATAKLLGHLVSFHYSEKIFKLYPFNKGALCPLCIDSGEKFDQNSFHVS